MNKKFAAALEEMGFKNTNGSFTQKKGGYCISANLLFNGNMSFLCIHVSFYADDTKKNSIVSDIEALKIKMVKVLATPYGVMLQINGMTNKTILTKAKENLDSVLSIIKNYDVLGENYCPVCGEEFGVDDFDYRVIQGMSIKLHKHCIDAINEEIDKEKAEFDSLPNNYLKGFAGALIGGLVGAILTIVIYYTGFISALSSIVAIFLGTFLYQKFQGKPNKMMILIVSLTTFVLIIASIFGVYLFEAGKAAKEAGLNINAFDALKILMKDSEIKNAFTLDLVLTCVFTLVGIGFEVFTVMKAMKDKHKHI